MLLFNKQQDLLYMRQVQIIVQLNILQIKINFLIHTFPLGKFQKRVLLDFIRKHRSIRVLMSECLINKLLGTLNLVSIQMTLRNRNTCNICNDFAGKHAND